MPTAWADRQTGRRHPSANVRHLSLAQELQQAVADEQFFIWAVDDVSEALPILTQLLWDGEGQTLRQTIQERIAQATQQERSSSLSVAATLVEAVQFELIGLVQRTRVSYPASRTQK